MQDVRTSSLPTFHQQPIKFGFIYVYLFYGEHGFVYIIHPYILLSQLENQVAISILAPNLFIFLFIL